MRNSILSIFDEEDVSANSSRESKPEFLSDKETLSKLKDVDSIAFNSEAERQFVDFVCSLCSDFERLTQNDVIQESSFELNISPVTAKRYLLKHSARRAQFAVVNGFVKCKCSYHSRRYEVKVLKKN